MKNLNINQMEGLNGGISQRNCSILGIVIVASAITGVWLATLGAVGAAASSDCF